MSLRSFVTIVASPRPHVGKTLLARMLADYHLGNDRKVAAFDLNARDAALIKRRGGFRVSAIADCAFVEKRKC